MRPAAHPTTGGFSCIEESAEHLLTRAIGNQGEDRLHHDHILLHILNQIACMHTMLQAMKLDDLPHG